MAGVTNYRSIGAASTLQNIAQLLISRGQSLNERRGNQTLGSNLWVPFCYFCSDCTGSIRLDGLAHCFVNQPARILANVREKLAFKTVSVFCVREF